MYEPQQQHLFDNLRNDGNDPRSWHSSSSDDHHRNGSSMHQRTHSSLSNASASAGDVHRVIYDEIAEMLPLIQTLIDEKKNTKFTRKGSMIYTKTPSRESLATKITDPKARNGTHSIPTKKQRDQSKNLGTSLDGSSESFSVFSSKSLTPEKDREELVALRQQVEDLQRKLLEKEELLKSSEISKNEMDSIQAKLDEIKAQATEKDSLLKSTQQQLADTKIKLADKQAAVEKLQWESTTSNQQVEKLQKDLNMIQGEISLFMASFEELARESSAFTADVVTYPSDQHFDIDDLNDSDLQELEAAREAYIAAVAAAKEKQDEESLAAAASARLRLQSFVLGTKS